MNKMILLYKVNQNIKIKFNQKYNNWIKLIQDNMIFQVITL